MFSLLVSCSRHRPALVLGRTCSEIVGWRSVLWPARHYGSLGLVGYRCACAISVQPLLHDCLSTCSLRRTLAFNVFFCEAGSGSTTCRFSLAFDLNRSLAGHPRLLPRDIEGLSRSRLRLLDRRLPSRVVINGIRSTTGVLSLRGGKHHFFRARDTT